MIPRMISRMTPRINRPSTVFGQLVAVISLCLLGAFVLSFLLVRELWVRPAAEQSYRVMDGFARTVETLARKEPIDTTVSRLQAAGLRFQTAPPVDTRPRIAPYLRELASLSGAGDVAPREVRIADGPGGRPVLWLRLRTEPSLWISFARERAQGEVRWLPLLILLACALAVLVAAGCFARRLVIPLRSLAQHAPDVVRGEWPRLPLPQASREVAELAQALGRAGDDLRAMMDDRNLMLAGISHDLRTPMMRLQYAVELLPGTDPELRAGMHRDIEEMDDILGQFIAYARDGRDENNRILDLAAICRQVVAASGVDWQLQVPDQAWLRGRPMALLRALENLVTNALRHGAPPYELRLRREGDAWCVDVIDHGSGMPPGHSREARKPFVHDATRGGSGLGLAIVERIAAQHAGDLQLGSHLPHGLRATLRLKSNLE